MGNSDSKGGKNTPRTSLTSSQSYKSKVHTTLESEFAKRADPQSGTLSRDGFHACLKAIQGQFDFVNIAYSPLATGLFEISLKERPGGKSLMTITEFASAMAVLFNNLDANTLTALTNQSILRWFQVTFSPKNLPATPSEEILISFFEASWKFGWSELSNRIISNVCLNGKSETDAIERFSEANRKFFITHPGELNVALLPPVDKTIILSIGDEEVQIPTSFSFIIRNRGIGSEYPQKRTFNQPSSAYPEL
jgi:hypothetical protein